MTIKRTHGIFSGAERKALKLRATPGRAQGALLGAIPVNANERFPPAALGSFKRWLGGAVSYAAID
jgi:hypothetical protein